MTLTLPALAHAGCILWLVCGADKADALARLIKGDAGVPAARIAYDRAWIAADASALPAGV